MGWVRFKRKSGSILLDNPQQAKEELADMYGREFNGYLLEGAVEETDELLEDKAVVRAEEIEFEKDIEEIRR